MLKKIIFILIIIILIQVLFISSVSAYNENMSVDFIKLFEEHGSIMLIIDPADGQIVYANKTAVDYYGYGNDILNMSISQINTLTNEEVKQEMDNAIAEKRNYFIFEHKNASGNIRKVEVYSKPFNHDGTNYLFSIIYDIQESELLKVKEERRDSIIKIGLSVFSIVQITVIFLLFKSRKEKEYLNKKLEKKAWNDQLTGLPNRYALYKKIKELKEESLPLQLFLIDINNLKLINDTFGHIFGDELIKKVANGLNQVFSENAFISRLSGDEFVVLLPNCQQNESKNYIDQIRKLRFDINGVATSVAIGSSTMENSFKDYYYCFKIAEEEMYEYKISSKYSFSKDKVDSILMTLHEKSKSTELHSHRVSQYALELGKQLGMKEEELEELKNIALMHDIGKIGIDLALLDKPSKLTQEEYEEIKRHCEKGYRIASSLRGSKDLCDAVLYHHERFDGRGYPYNLKGKDIPIYARIIAIADSFDAMTSMRSYKDSLSLDEAIKELRICSGSQFDPYLVEVFINGDIKAVYEITRNMLE